MLLSKKPVLLLSSLVLFAITAFTVYAAPMSQGQGSMESYFDAPTGNLRSNWRYNKFLPPGHWDRQEQQTQERRISFQQFSEKFVSADCAPLLASTLIHLDKVRGFVHRGFKTKASFEFLEPILKPLVEVLDLHKNYTFPDKVVLKEEYKASSAQANFGHREPGVDDYDIIEKAAWTEENEPEFLLKFRLRYLEKNLGVFQHVLKVAPEPVRQELEISGFVQDVRVLREHARSLLTCQGVPHVTVAGLQEDVGETESDSYVDRDAALQATVRFYRYYHNRMVLAYVLNISMDPARAAHCGLRNVTDSAPSKPSESQLLEEEADPSPKYSFVWSNEAVMRMVTSTIKRHRRDPELAAVLFQDLF